MSSTEIVFNYLWYLGVKKWQKFLTYVVTYVSSINSAPLYLGRFEVAGAGWLVINYILIEQGRCIALLANDDGLVT